MEEEGDREGGKEGERERKRRDFFLFFQIGHGIEMRQSVGRIRSVETLFFSFPPIGGR